MTLVSNHAHHFLPKPYNSLTLVLLLARPKHFAEMHVSFYQNGSIRFDDSNLNHAYVWPFELAKRVSAFL